MFSIRVLYDDEQKLRVFVYNQSKRFREVGNPEQSVEDRFKAALTNLDVLASLDASLQPELPLEEKKSDGKSTKTD